MRFTPSEALEINLSGDVTRDDRDAVLNQVTRYLTNGTDFDTDEVAVDQRSTDERDMDGASASFDYVLSDCWTLTAISGYRNTEITVYSDIDVGLLLDCNEPPDAMAAAIDEAKDLDARYGKKLSVFWGNPEYGWGRLPRHR